VLREVTLGCGEDVSKGVFGQRSTVGHGESPVSIRVSKHTTAVTRVVRLLSADWRVFFLSYCPSHSHQGKSEHQ
jgi:hypothetical protein